MVGLRPTRRRLVEAKERLQSLEGERKELAETLADTVSRAEAARAGLQELESGDAEQKRRLREQERENDRLELQQKLTAQAAARREGDGDPRCRGGDRGGWAGD